MVSQKVFNSWHRSACCDSHSSFRDCDRPIAHVFTRGFTNHLSILNCLLYQGDNDQDTTYPADSGICWVSRVLVIVSLVEQAVEDAQVIRETARENVSDWAVAVPEAAMTIAASTAMPTIENFLRYHIVSSPFLCLMICLPCFPFCFGSGGRTLTPRTGSLLPVLHVNKMILSF